MNIQIAAQDAAAIFFAMRKGTHADQSPTPFGKSDVWSDWANVAIYARSRFEVRRIDIIGAVSCILLVAHYAYYSGWSGALFAALLYALGAMTGLWFLRGNA